MPDGCPVLVPLAQLVEAASSNLAGCGFESRGEHERSSPVIGCDAICMWRGMEHLTIIPTPGVGGGRWPIAFVAQWIGRPPPERKAAGSSPAEGTGAR